MELHSGIVLGQTSLRCMQIKNSAPKKKPNSKLDPQIVDGHCPHCDAKRKCNQHVTFTQSFNDESDDGRHSYYGAATHSLLECRGCETVFYLKSSWDSEDWDGRLDPLTNEEQIYHPVKSITYPSPELASSRPGWMAELYSKDVLLEAMVSQTYASYDTNLLILTAIGLRTAFDRAAELSGVDPAMSFEQKISHLEANGKIGSMESLQLTRLVDAGNAAAHRSWAPWKDECLALMKVFEHFIQRTILAPSTENIDSRIPKRQKRKKDSQKP